MNNSSQIDVSALGIDLSLIAPEIALVVAAFIILLIGYVKNFGKLSPLIAIFGILVSLYFSLQQWGDPASGFSGMVTSDNFGVAFRFIFLATAFLAILISHNFLKVKGLDKPEFYALVCFSTMGMMVMANTTDLIVMFLGLEIMSVPLYVLAGFARRNLLSNEAGIKYFIMGAFASAFLLMGIAFIFGASGTTDLRRIIADFAYLADYSHFYFYSGIALVLVGFGFKVGLVPFHSWVPDVYQGAPTPITAFFSVGPKAAGFAVLLRIFSFGFGELELLEPTFWVLAVLTMTVGNIMALKQDNIKRMLAYSSIAHAGYILMALTVGGLEGVSSAMFYLIAYGLFNFGAFAILVMIESRSGGSTDFKELKGLSKAHPYLTTILALFMFALAGFPPTVGFIGKFYIFSAVLKSGFIWLALIGVMNSFLSVYYYLRVVKVSCFEESNTAFSPVTLTPALILVLVITVLGTLGFGIFPEQILEFSRNALFAFL